MVNFTAGYKLNKNYRVNDFYSDIRERLFWWFQKNRSVYLFFINIHKFVDFISLLSLLCLILLVLETKYIFATQRNVNGSKWKPHGKRSFIVDRINGFLENWVFVLRKVILFRFLHFLHRWFRRTLNCFWDVILLQSLLRVKPQKKYIWTVAIYRKQIKFYQRTT